MGEAVAPRERVALLDIALQKRDGRVPGELSICSAEMLRITAEYCYLQG